MIAMASFDFKGSTPHPIVSRILGTYFIKQSKQPLSIMSSKGIMEAGKVKILDLAMATFLKAIPVVPETVLKQCNYMIQRLEKDGTLQMTTIEDVLQEISARTLSAEEFGSLMKWFVSLRTKQVISPPLVARFMESALIPPSYLTSSTSIAQTSSNNKVALAAIKSHINVRVIPPDVPLPSDSLPLALGKLFSKGELEQILGWAELSIVDWCIYIATEHCRDLEMSAPFSEKILGVVSRVWNSLSQENRATIISIFSTKKCIPTRSGMKLPEQSYFKVRKECSIVILLISGIL